MIIKLVPTGGLGNRMRAIASAIAIAEHYQAPIEILWNARKGLNANFEQLFLPIDRSTVPYFELTSFHPELLLREFIILAHGSRFGKLRFYKK